MVRLLRPAACSGPRGDSLRERQDRIWNGIFRARQRSGRSREPEEDAPRDNLGVSMYWPAVGRPTKSVVIAVVAICVEESGRQILQTK